MASNVVLNTIGDIQPGDTIWTRFLATNLASSDTDPDQILAFLQFENTKMQTQHRAAGKNPIKLAPLYADAFEFFVRFSAFFGEREEIVKAVSEYWCFGPFLFRMARDYGEREDCSLIPSKLARNAILMATYIMEEKEDKILTFRHKDKEEEEFICTRKQCFSCSESQEFLALLLSLLTTPINAEIRFRHGSMEWKWFTVEGFRVENGVFEGIGEEEMRRLCGDPMVRYKAPEVLFLDP